MPRCVISTTRIGFCIVKSDVLKKFLFQYLEQSTRATSFAKLAGNEHVSSSTTTEHGGFPHQTHVAHDTSFTSSTTLFRLLERRDENYIVAHCERRR
jgi:hypothetical protein